jgi:molybdopterin synthase catalytic subunit
MIEIRLVPGSLPPIPSDDSRRDDGSELVFHGRVRAEECGREILALDYEHYPGMTEKELEALAGETVARFGVHDLVCHHRVGRIPVGEVALRLVIRSRHRAEGIEALRWFLHELKQRVPMWKWAVAADGTRSPSPPEAPPVG